MPPQAVAGKLAGIGVLPSQGTLGTVVNRNVGWGGRAAVTNGIARQKD